MNKKEVVSDSYSQTTGVSATGTPVMRRITSDVLLAGQRELVIEHLGEEYRLRVTSKRKLILTK